jgi:hypothetical protein
VRDVDDVLLELGAVLPEAVDDATTSTSTNANIAEAGAGAALSTLGDDDRAVLEALGWEPATLEHVAVRTGLGLGALSTTLHRFRDLGHRVEQGGWYERVAR